MRAPILRLAAFAARALPGPVKRLLYRARPFADVLRRQLNRAAPPGLTEVTVAGGELSGARLLLDLRSEKDLWLGTYEPELLAALLTWRNRPDPVPGTMTLKCAPSGIGEMSSLNRRQREAE